MNPQREAVLELARRYRYEPDHAHQVECLVGTLFLELQPLHRLEREDRRLLEYAAILHDIGYFISSRSHHRHGLQMIMMEPLPAFTWEEKTVIANLVRYHRKVLPEPHHTAYGILSDTDRQRVDLMAPLLRVADALDRAHRQAVKELFCEWTDTLVTLHIQGESEMALEEETLMRKADMFRLVYQREVQLQRANPPSLPADRKMEAMAQP